VAFVQVGAVAAEHPETSIPLIENEERRGPILGLAPAEFLLALLFVLLIGLAGLLQYKQSQLDKAKRELDAVFSQAGQGRSAEQATAPLADVRGAAEQSLRITGLEAALIEARRERDALRTEVAALRPLQAVADNAAKIDPSQPPVQVLQRAVFLLQAAGTAGDPARSISDLRQQNEYLRQQIALQASELGQVTRENETLTRDGRREREAMQAELAELRPLKPLADAAAKVDPRQPAPRVMQRALAALESVGNSNADPARAVRELKSENEELRKRGAAVSSENDKLRREKDGTVGVTRQAEKENEALRSELAGLQAFKPIAEAASKIAPGEPPAAVVQRALSAMSFGKVPAGDEGSAAASLKEENEALQRKLAVLVDEKEQLQREKAALGRSGTLDFPSCWANQQGDTEFLLEVTIKDSAVIVRDIAPAVRHNDPNLRLLARLPRNTEIRPDTFRAAVAPLYRWSVREKCRFFVQMQDGTSETSKEIYKKARQMVEGVFYVKHL
jgi:hypothetical protein